MTPVVLITGGADGIGWATARRFASGGHRVAIADLRAEAIWFLASPAASYISGTVLNVDGGWQAFGMAGDAPAVD